METVKRTNKPNIRTKKQSNVASGRRSKSSSSSLFYSTVSRVCLVVLMLQLPQLALSLSVPISSEPYKSRISLMRFDMYTGNIHVKLDAAPPFRSDQKSLPDDTFVRPTYSAVACDPHDDAFRPLEVVGKDGDNVFIMSYENVFADGDPKHGVREVFLCSHEGGQLHHLGEKSRIEVPTR